MKKTKPTKSKASATAKHPFPKQDPNKPRPVVPIAGPKPQIA